MKDKSLIKSLKKSVFSVTVRSLAARKMCDYKRANAGLYYGRHSFKGMLNI